MISGYISSRQELVDLLNGYLSTRAGTLDIFFGSNIVSLCVDRGFVKGFRVTEDEHVYEGYKNKRSLLLYKLTEFFERPEAFFTFREEKVECIELEEPIHAEEIVLQLQLANQELRSLMEKVITPMAVVRVLKKFDDFDLYSDREIYQILVNSPRSLVEEIRRLKSLFSEGYIDISQFNPVKGISEDAGVEYLFKRVELDKVSMPTIFESLQLSGFSGLVQIVSSDAQFEIYFKKGKLIAVYPYSIEIFDLLLSPPGGSYLNVVDIKTKIIDLILLKHSENKVVSGLPGSFVEMGKVLMGMNRERRTGMVTVYLEGTKYYLMYKDGILMSVVEDGWDGLKGHRTLVFSSVGWLDIAFYEPMENVRIVCYLFLINILYGILLKHAGHINQSVLSYLSSSDIFKHEEGVITYRRMPKDYDGVFAFLHFLLDMSYSMLGKEKLGEELQIALQPYRDILRIMKIEDYLRLPEA
ncbi:MAG: DUF4388 domain-containing protein [Acidobacteria bacterium]|jgi:hypothetical protein|nr:MAG: DUF4388 domain-containing protein [Acidobacteriota bacterium]